MPEIMYVLGNTTTSQPGEIGLPPPSGSFRTIQQKTVNKQKPVHEETDNDNVNQ